jgi:hypothetical protein
MPKKPQNATKKTKTPAKKPAKRMPKKAPVSQTSPPSKSETVVTKSAPASTAVMTAPPLSNNREDAGPIPETKQPSQVEDQPPETIIDKTVQAEPAVPAQPTPVPADPVKKAKVADPNPVAAPSSRPAPKVRRKRLLPILAGAILVASSLAGLLWYLHHAESPEALSKANRNLVAEVAERAVLPQGETPTVTTVVDKDKANQSFLANSANGDKVLLYFQAGRAILYRPSTHQVVNIGPLSQPPARVFLRDGRQGDIPQSFSAKLTGAAGFMVVSQDASSKQDYADTVVVDVAGNRPDVAARVAKLVGGRVSQMPGGESRPDADVLVIVGSDAK